MKRKGSRTIHKEAVNIFKEKIEEWNNIVKERQKYGLTVMTIPGLEKLNKKEYGIVKIACNHIIEDIKEYQKEGVKLPIGTKLEILRGS